MTRKINEQGLDLIRQWEGLRLEAYQDSAGVWTIGYGHTSAAGRPNVQKGLRISAGQAADILARDLGQYERAVEESVKVPLNDNQFAALVSFSYNVGTGAFKRSTLLRKLNAGDYDSVPSELMRWTRAGKKHLAGLKNRRAAEGGLWAKGAFVASREVRPRPVDDNPVVKVETVAPIAGPVAGLGEVLSGEGVIQYALAFVMVVACLVGAWWFVKRQREQST